MFPGHRNGGAHIVCQDDKLRGTAVVMGAETHNVDLSHSGAQIIQKTSGEQEGEEEWLGYLSCIG